MGRFAGEDAIRNGTNWYGYCLQNPIKYIDVLGFEEIVVSGGVYSQDKFDNRGGYYYEFVDAGLAQIDELQKNGGNEDITWIVADNGWTNTNKSEMQKAASHKGVDLVFVSNSQEVINYLNTKDASNSGNISSQRKNDRVSNISVFSHGLIADDGTISLGYNYTDSYPQELNITKGDISRINEDVFTDHLQSSFYACNIGTAGDTSFAQCWVNRFGGATMAFNGTTNYADVADQSLLLWINRNICEILFGISVFGGQPHLPVASDGVDKIWFSEECE